VKPGIDKKQIREDILLRMQPLVRVLLKRSKGFQENQDRGSYAPWFKESVYDILETQAVTYQEVMSLTGIPVRTLEKFKEFVDQLKLEKGPITEFHLIVERAWEMATDLEKKD
jgi:hypothetical protein